MTAKLLDDTGELEKYLVPLLTELGMEVPPRGCWAAAVEFDDSGAVVAFQIIQNAIFLEGLWSKGGNLLRLHRMVTKYADEKLGAQRLMTMARKDATGEHIGRTVRRLGYDEMPWTVYRRKV